MAPSATMPDDVFLPNWMGHVWPAIKGLTILDLSLPGTHDTMTYDLSTSVADGGLDDYEILSDLLHDLGTIIPVVGEFIQPQAQTQNLNLTEQLNNGIRFLDFRTMNTGDSWRSLHCVQSNGLSLDYLKEVKVWMDNHPTEIVVIMVSKHGSPCASGNHAYPGISQAEKMKFWSDIEGLFGSLLIDNSSPVNTTAISEMVENGQRVLMYVSDYTEFTNSSPKAVDGCLVDSNSPVNVLDEVSSFNDTMMKLKNMPETLRSNRKVNKFALLSFAQSQGKAVIWDNARLEFDPTVDIMEVRHDCAKQFDIPSFTVSPWCPGTLLDVAQLSNYYNQVVINAALENGWGLPNAIYIDAVDVGGTLRTGPRRLKSGAKGAGGHSQDDPTCVVFKYTSCQTHQPACDAGFIADGTKVHSNTYDSDGNAHGVCGFPWQDHYRCCRKEPLEQDTARFAYVDALVLYGVTVGCSRNTSISECEDLRSLLQQRRAKFPVKLWDDAMTGRFTSWPPRPWEHDRVTQAHFATFIGLILVVVSLVIILIIGTTSPVAAAVGHERSSPTPAE